MQIIDLSVVLNDDTPVYPGDPKIVIKPLGIFEKDTYNDHLITMANHIGTHIDAPMHMVEGGKNLDQIPIDNFIGRGRLIEVKNKVFDFEAIKKVDIQAGDIVLFYTGMINKYGEDDYYNNRPEISEAVAKYLVEKKIKMVGMDMLSPDKEPFNIHKILLGGGVLIIENMTNLDKLIGKDFVIYALPIKFQLDGAPARVIAQIAE